MEIGEFRCGGVEFILIMNANADWFPGLINWIISPLLTGRAVCQWVLEFFDMIVKLGNLKNYIESVHAKAKCPCNLCECKATSQGILKTHNESVHENVQYCLHSHHTRKDSTNFHLHFNFIDSPVLPGRECKQTRPGVTTN